MDGFYEWMATKGGKQPYAIAMRDGSPFGIAAIWENWKDPAGEWVRTFAVLTTAANEMVARIHDRMPAILRPEDYDRWLGMEPDPRDLLAPFPAEPMTMWPVHISVFLGHLPSSAICQRVLSKRLSTYNLFLALQDRAPFFEPPTNPQGLAKEYPAINRGGLSI